MALQTLGHHGAVVQQTRLFWKTLGGFAQNVIGLLPEARVTQDLGFSLVLQHGIAWLAFRNGADDGARFRDASLPHEQQRALALGQQFFMTRVCLLHPFQSFLGLASQLSRLGHQQIGLL